MIESNYATEQREHLKGNHTEVPIRNSKRATRNGLVYVVGGYRLETLVQQKLSLQIRR